MNNKDIEVLIKNYEDLKKDNIDLAEAENKIIAAFDPFIRAKALTFSNIDSVSTDDFIQEGRLGLCNALERFNENKKTNFYAYAMACINNSMLDLVRRQASLTNKYISDALPLQELQEDTSKIESPEDAVIFNELMNNIEKVLTEYQYKVFNMYIEGYSYDQIAEKCNKSKKDIDNCIQQIKKKIKNLF